MRSYLPDYDLVTPKHLPEALGLLASGNGWRPIAGGTDLMVLMNAGKLPYQRLLAVDRLPELTGMTETEPYFVFGAATTFTDLRGSRTSQEHFPLLCQAASWTGGAANQNRGTIGGNIANASPAADSSPALLVYKAELSLMSLAGSRWVPYCDFHTGYKQMRLTTDELITSIRLPWPVEGVKHHGRKVGTRKAQAISKVCIAATAESKGGVIYQTRIAFGSVAPVPLRCFRTEEALRGQRLDSKLIDKAQTVLASEIQPITDIRSTGNYRAAVACNLLREFLESLA